MRLATFRHCLALAATLAFAPHSAAMAQNTSGQPSSLWRAYELVTGSDERMAMRKVSHRRDIYPVFRDLFAREKAGA